MSNSAFSNVSLSTAPKAKFTRHQVHEVVNNSTEARQIAKDFSNATRYPHRMSVTIDGAPNLRPYDPIYLDGLLNGLSGYWTVLSVRHIFNGPYGNYLTEIQVGTDVLGDVNPEAATASQVRNLTSSLINQSAATNESVLIDTSFVLPVDDLGISELSLVTTNVVSPTPMLFSEGSPSVDLVTTTTPDFSKVQRPVAWNSAATINTGVAPTQTSYSTTSNTATSVPTLSAVTSVVNTDESYNEGSATVTVAAQTNGGSTISLYTVTTDPSTDTFTSTTPEVEVTGLASDTSYVFTAIATNAVGDSVSLSTDEILITTKPQAPTIGTATRVNGSTVTVAFTAEDDGGSSITGYTVSASPTVENMVVTGTSSPLTVVGSFTKNTSYTFTIAAINANGTGAFSGSSNSVTGLGLSTMTNAKVYFMKG